MKQLFPFYIFCLWQLVGNAMIYFCTADLRRGYSLLQRGYRLEKRLITNFGGISFLDCVEECLRTTRCLSVNYFQPAHFCEVSYKNKESLPALNFVKSGWYYSERDDWDKVFLLLFSSRENYGIPQILILGRLIPCFNIQLALREKGLWQRTLKNYALWKYFSKCVKFGTQSTHFEKIFKVH